MHKSAQAESLIPFNPPPISVGGEGLGHSEILEFQVGEGVKIQLETRR